MGAKNKTFNGFWCICRGLNLKKRTQEGNIQRIFIQNVFCSTRIMAQRIWSIAPQYTFVIFLKKCFLYFNIIILIFIMNFIFTCIICTYAHILLSLFVSFKNTTLLVYCLFKLDHHSQIEHVL